MTFVAAVMVGRIDRLRPHTTQGWPLCAHFEQIACSLKIKIELPVIFFSFIFFGIELMSPSRICINNEGGFENNHEGQRKFK